MWTQVNEIIDITIKINCIIYTPQLATVVTLSALPNCFAKHRVIRGHHQLSHLPVINISQYLKKIQLTTSLRYFLDPQYYTIFWNLIQYYNLMFCKHKIWSKMNVKITKSVYNTHKIIVICIKRIKNIIKI